MRRITALTTGTLAASVLGIGVFAGTAMADSGPVQDGTGPVAAQSQDETCDGTGEAVRARAGQANGEAVRAQADGACDGTGDRVQTRARNGSGQGSGPHGSGACQA